MRAFLFAALTLSAVGFAETTHVPCDFSVSQAAASGDLQLAKSVFLIFENNCKSCHGKGQTAGANVMTDIMDRDALLRDGMINLADPDASKIIKAIYRPNRQMPLNKPPLPQPEKDSILAWIKAEAPDPNGPATVNDPILSHYQEVECIRHDQAVQAKAHGQHAVQYQRYLTFGHLKGKEFDTARAGAIKAVNLLNRGSAPRAPDFVDKLGKILRVDLRYYEPTLTTKAWEKYVINGYPYAYLSDDDHVFNNYVYDVNKIAYSERAFVRGDFFIGRFADPDAYYAIMQIPSKLAEFEFNQLGIDIEKELVNGYAKRIGVSKSGVTNYPRLIDHFELDIYANGSFTKAQHWITRDFSSDKGTSNVYAFPFGPRVLNKYSGWIQDQLFAAKVFENQASEGITATLSGFDMYSIWSGDGKRLNKADPHVAIDKSGLFDDNSVQVPVSCVMCHAGGVNPTDDDTVPSHIRGSPAFSVEELEFAELLFFDYAGRHKAFDQHANSFKAAMHAIGLKDPDYLTIGGEPTSKAFRRFTGSLTCKDLAWELGISVPKLETNLKHSPDLARQLGLGDCATGSLSRENYVHLFGKVLKEFDMGTQIKVGGGHVVVPPKCDFVIKNKLSYSVDFNLRYGARVVSNNLRVGASHVVKDRGDVVISSKLWDGHRWLWVNNSLVDCHTYEYDWDTAKRAVLYKR